MTTSRSQDTNNLLKSYEVFQELSEALKSDSGNIDWKNSQLIFNHSQCQKRENIFGSFDDSLKYFSLTSKGINAFVRSRLDFETLMANRIERYKLENILGVGTESVVFCASHITLGTRFAIKLFTNPDAESAFHQVTDGLKTRHSGTMSGIVLPIDEFQLPVKTLSGDELQLQCAVFPLVEGVTLRKFCEIESPLSPYFISDLIRQLTLSLKELESIGICHGDLHLDNILVDQRSDGTVAFKIVDISGKSSEDAPSDFECFRGILVHVLSMLPLRKMSLQKHLGPRLYCTVEDILRDRADSFSALLSRIEADVPYKEYERQRSQFIKEQFRSGEALGLFKHEELVDSTVARQMFVPYESFFRDFSLFGNAILYGNRGSGKSSYMASLAYYPSANSHIVSPETSLGILFACRQGEFRQYFSASDAELSANILYLRHLLLTKIVRKTCKLFCDLLSTDSRTSFELAPLVSFLRLAYPQIFFQLEGLSRWEALDSIYQTLVRHETELQQFILQPDTTRRNLPLGAESLANFFSAIRQTFDRFFSSRFFILFDDAGTPNIPPAIQRAINDLLISRNSIFCVKVSSERNSYDDRDSTGTAVEVSHDVALFNLSEVYYVPSGISPDRGQLRDYFRKLVNLRLKNYEAIDIAAYLGEVPVKTTALVSKLATDQPKSAYYAGWEIVWQLANSNPRILLELISGIFTYSGITSGSKPDIIPLPVQDECIRSFSENRLRALKYLPGRMTLLGKPVGTGQQIFSIATTFGKISRQRLRDDAKNMNKRPKRKRFSEMLAIEVDKGSDLPTEPNEVLKQLVRFGVFDDCRLITAWDDQKKKPLFLFNRIYTPALGMSFRRDIHWRVSANRLSHFLLRPNSVQTYLSSKTEPETHNQNDLI